MTPRRGVLAGALFLGLAIRLAFAGDPPSPENRITVQVEGRAEAKATVAELELTVNGHAEEAQEAEQKYREKLRHVLAGLSGDKGEEKPAKKKGKKDEEEEGDGELEKRSAAIPFVVTERGFHVVATRKADEEADPTKVSPPGARFESKVVVTISGLDKLDPTARNRRLAQLIDAGVAAGADPMTGEGEPPVVRFLCGDPEGQKKSAYADAMAHARSRAGALAELSERKLGAVATVKESYVPAADPTPRGDEKKNTLEVQSLVELEVTFVLEAR